MKLPFWATLLTLLGIAILCALGTWQLQRLAWKNDILQKLDTAYESEKSQKMDTADFKDGEFRYGEIGGIFMPDKAILLGPKTKDSKIGYDLIAPIKHKKGTILVNMGWTESSKLEDLPIYYVSGKFVRFEGLARKPGWNSFTPDNDPAENLWYKPDIEEIAAVKELKNPLPFMFYAERSSYKFDGQFPNNQRWSPNNNHFQYALFWFFMAGALALIYVLRFVRKA